MSAGELDPKAEGTRDPQGATEAALRLWRGCTVYVDESGREDQDPDFVVAGVALTDQRELERAVKSFRARWPFLPQGKDLLKTSLLADRRWLAERWWTWFRSQGGPLPGGSVEELEELAAVGLYGSILRILGGTGFTPSPACPARWRRFWGFARAVDAVVNRPGFESKREPSRWDPILRDGRVMAFVQSLLEEWKGALLVPAAHQGVVREAEPNPKNPYRYIHLAQAFCWHAAQLGAERIEVQGRLIAHGSPLSPDFPRSKRMVAEDDLSGPPDVTVRIVDFRKTHRAGHLAADCLAFFQRTVLNTTGLGFAVRLGYTWRGGDDDL